MQRRLQSLHGSAFENLPQIYASAKIWQPMKTIDLLIWKFQTINSEFCDYLRCRHEFLFSLLSTMFVYFAHSCFYPTFWLRDYRVINWVTKFPLPSSIVQARVGYIQKFHEQNLFQIIKGVKCRKLHKDAIMVIGCCFADFTQCNNFKLEDGLKLNIHHSVVNLPLVLIAIKYARSSQLTSQLLMSGHTNLAL